MGASFPNLRLLDHSAAARKLDLASASTVSTGSFRKIKWYSQSRRNAGFAMQSRF